MTKRLVVIATLSLLSGILVCEVQGLRMLAAYDAEDAERSPVMLNRLACDAARESGASGPATVVVMSWVGGQCTCQQYTLENDNPDHDPLLTDNWAAVEGPTPGAYADGFMPPRMDSERATDPIVSPSAAEGPFPNGHPDAPPDSL